MADTKDKSKDTKTKEKKKKVTDITIRKQLGTENTLLATWKFSGKHLDKFEVKWYYTTAQGAWIDGSTGSPEKTSSTYDPPAPAVKVYVSVLPVAKEHEVETEYKDSKGKTKKKKVKKAYWKATTVKSSTYTIKPEWRITTPGTPDEPKFDKDGNLTVSLSGYENEGNSTVTDIEFQIVKDNTTQAGVPVKGTYYKDMKYASALVTGLAKGSEYKVRCRAIAITERDRKGNILKKGGESEWSDFTSPVGTIPGKITEKPTLTATSDSVVRVTWVGISHVKNYEIQYVADDAEYFDTRPDEVTSSRPDVESSKTVRDITGLDNSEGKTYFFRVRGFNDVGDGAWSEIVSTTVGTKPEPPTTWSYTNTASIGDIVTLNWSHNSEDGSKQKAAQIEVTIGSNKTTINVTPNDSPSYNYDTKSLSDGDEVSWKVRTKGAASEPDLMWSDWSTSRTFTVYTQPSVDIGLYDEIKWYWDTFNFATDNIYDAKGEGTNFITEITRYPFVVKATASPTTQEATSFAISIVANDSYETLDETGMSTYVYAGDEVFSEVILPESNEIERFFKPSDVDLEEGINYTLSVTVSMNSGLSATNALEFGVSWEEEVLFPDAEVSINYADLCCYIRPYAEDGDGNEVENVLLSVYRREYNGRFVEVASNISGTSKLSVVDPHPALDYARYRVICLSRETGAMNYYDIPAMEIGHDSIVIQWEEAWAPFDNREDLSLFLAEQPSTGSMLQLPYNIDVSIDAKPDVALVEYIGRSNPVSYYGTQMGETAKWSTEIPKEDKETLYSIRRLAAYMGDVYVREPSGTGYWANVVVSYNIQHSKTTVPISFSITRVEGGT